MKKLLVVLMALAMIVSMLAVFPFATSADGDETATVWSGKANIKWYLDALEENPEANEFHLQTAEDLAGLAYLVNASYDAKNQKACYNAIWYDTATGDVLGFQISGSETGNAYNFTELGFYIPAPAEKFNAEYGQYLPDYDDDMEPIDGSATIAGSTFEYKTVYLDADVVLNTGDAADWASEKPMNVWMPIGGVRPNSSTHAYFNGTFKGQGHTVSGVYISSETRFGFGLFGYIAKERATVIQDLIVENCYICGSESVGAIAGRTTGMATLTNCHVKNAYLKATGSVAGGLVGGVFGGSAMFEQCSATGMTIESRNSVGGFVGSLNFQSAYFTDCLVQGTVHGYTVTDGEVTKQGWDVGGLIGRVGQGSITVSCVIADVELFQDGNDYGEENSSYTASAGIVYGAVAKKGSTEESRFSAPQLSIESMYYVDNIHSASGQIVPFPAATKISENMLVGNKPKATVFGFDFEKIWDYGSKNTEDSIVAQLPQLRNMGKTTDEEEGGEDDPGIVTEHVYGTWIKEQKATCTEDGVKAHYHCSHCEKNFDSEYVEITDLTIRKKGHTYGEWIEEKAATSDAEGAVAHYHCSACGKDFDKDHNEIANIVIPKVEKSGCFGVIAGVPFVAVVVFGAALLVRKKEEENK